MGRRMGRGIRLILLLFCSTIMAISSAAFQQQIFPSESNYQQKTYTEEHGKDGVTNQIDRRYSASAITVSNEIRRGSSGHGSAAAAAAAGGENGGGSRPHTGGGTAVIPVYAAGSAQARHQGRPHNAGNRYENNMGLLVAAVLAAIAHLCRFF